jgi:uncharacterized repeat protein (TIGR01451 family)
MFDEHKSKLEEVERKLYSLQGAKEHKRRDLKSHENSLEKDWIDPNQNKDKGSNLFNYYEEVPKKRSLFGFVFAFSAIFFILALGYAAYYFFFILNTPVYKNISIEVFMPTQVVPGDVVSYRVKIANQNPVAIKDVEFIQTLPEGTQDADDPKLEKRIVNEDLGEISSGEVFEREYKAIFFGEEGQNKDIQFKVNYKTDNSSAIYSPQKGVSFGLGGSPIKIETSTLKEVTSGQPYSLDITLRSNTTKEIDNVMLEIQYPFGFAFKDADINPTFENNIWLFDKLEPNKEIKIKVNGLLIGEENEGKIFKYRVGIKDKVSEKELGVKFVELISDVLIRRPFLGMDIYINDNKSSIVSVDNDVSINNYINLINNTGDTLHNLEVVLKINDPNKIINQYGLDVSSGFYNSKDNTITWGRSNNEDLVKLDPGKTTKLNFGFNLLKTARSGAVLKNPNIRFDLYSKATRFDLNEVETSIVSDTFRVIKLNSDPKIFTSSHYFDSPFEKVGAIPTKINQKTLFAIKFQTTNTSNDIESAVIKGTLPANVELTGNKKPSDLDVSYNQVSREIVIKLGKLPAGLGFISSPKDIYLEVSIIPSANQINDTPKLILNPIFEGEDSYTQKAFSFTIDPPTIKLEELKDRDNKVSE